MGGAMHTEVTQDPSDGFRRLPPDSPDATPEFDVRIVLEPQDGGRIWAFMCGSGVPARGDGEILATLQVSADAVRDAASSLVGAWRGFVDHEPETDGPPQRGRALPFATRVDLTEEPAGELLGRVRTLVSHGQYVLFSVLLGGDDPATTFFREQVVQVLAHEGRRVRFVSRNLFLPWPMLCLRPGDLPPDGDRRDTLPSIFELFLGYRHRIEHTGDAHPEVSACPDRDRHEPAVSINHDVRVGRDLSTVKEVVQALRTSASFKERTSVGRLTADLRERHFDDDLMYFWCHGRYERNGVGPAQFVIRLSDGDDFGGHQFAAVRAEHGKQGCFEPFVLLNACHGGDAAVDASRVFLGQMLIKHGARGVLGPHIDMPYQFAAEFALEFLTRYLRGGEADTAGRIIHGLARDFAKNRYNPLGFAYGLHSGMDARIRRVQEDTA